VAGVRCPFRQTRSFGPIKGASAPSQPPSGSYPFLLLFFPFSPSASFLYNLYQLKLTLNQIQGCLIRAIRSQFLQRGPFKVPVPTGGRDSELFARKGSLNSPRRKNAPSPGAEGVGEQDERLVAPRTAASTPIECLISMEAGKNDLVLVEKNHPCPSLKKGGESLGLVEKRNTFSVEGGGEGFMACLP
jgi:hypothetical protein